MTTTKKDKKPQRDRFIEAARELSADEDEVAFDAKLKSIAGQKPKPEPEPEPEKDETPDK